MIQPQDLQPGTQIIYVPDQANNSLDHPDCEEGFVTSAKEYGAFCRYWSKHYPGHLRTTANSEMTRFENLVIMDTHPQEEVNLLLRIIEDEER